ncbi:MAG: NAD(P)/FAD-dependent oxidoreductase [Bacteroidetes bacterium]|nr:MAG: NAD(P)/FAD-dependent oxidoreductase [Bacteroidota bacterium]
MTPPVFDILIVGAGPAGTTCALALHRAGLRVALLEKAVFPRDKICGDAIPGPAFKVMDAIHPDWGHQMRQFSKGQVVRTSKIFAPNGKSFALHWVTHAYNARRLDFDQWLVHLLKENTSTEIFEGVKVNSIIQKENAWIVTAKTHSGAVRTFRAKIIVGADGANGVCARRLAGFEMDKNHHCAAVRTYVTGIADLAPTVNEFYLVSQYSPGYFWIFPLGNGAANVGFGMLSAEISRRRLHLKSVLTDLLTRFPPLQKRFGNARITADIKGFGLPLGSRIAPLSGDGFLLAGDAGSLIDPLQGHGIDKAMASGKMAAEQALRCLENHRTDAAFMKQYDDEIYRKWGAEFRRNERMLRWCARYPTLLNGVANLAQFEPVRRFFQKFA